MALTVLPHRDELGIKDGQLYVDGTWQDGADGETWTHVHPATHEEVGSFAVAAPSDVDRAVASARAAFDDGDWPRSKAEDRKRLLQRAGALLSDHADELNRLQTLDNSLPVSFSSIYQVSAEIAAGSFDCHAGWVDKIGGQTLPTYAGGE